VTTKAWLEGDPLDLQYLARLLPTGNAQVRQNDDRFYLAGAELDSPPPGEQFHDVAKRLITWANGAARCENPAFMPVSLAGSYQRDGGVTVVGAAARLTVRATMSATVQVTGPDGKPKPATPPAGPRYLTLAERDGDVAEVLKIMASTPDVNFVELYKVYEIIRHAGGLDAAMQAAGISKSTVSRFTRTANHQVAGGEIARHARSSEVPPANPLPIEEARGLIGRLVSAWAGTL
jgi:hypothetical protein